MKKPKLKKANGVPKVTQLGNDEGRMLSQIYQHKHVISKKTLPTHERNRMNDASKQL